MICASCGISLIDHFADHEIWFLITVVEKNGAVTSGHLCTMGCLIDYVARVAAMDLEEV